MSYPGDLYDLEQPRYAGAPQVPTQPPGLLYNLHRRHEAGVPGGKTAASGLIITPDHAGTHIDALCHYAENLELCGGLHVDAEVQTSTGFTALGAETIPAIVGPAVLLDVAAQQGVDRLPDEYAVTVADLEATAAAEGVAVNQGDVVLVRTGNGSSWADPDSYQRGPGMSAEASTWIADHNALAAGADNMAWDVIGRMDAELNTAFPGHVILLARAGIYIIENLMLEELSRARAYRFTLLCLPLKIRGATGSPVRPVALVEGDQI
jgi:kynurenine formamidase